MRSLCVLIGRETAIRVTFTEANLLRSSCRIKLKRHFYSLSLWDTASDEGCDRLRPLAYPQTDVFLICFSVDSPASFSNVRDKWLPEIQHFAQGIPIIFVGLQTDLRDKSLLLEKHAHPGTEMVTKHEGEQMARKYSSKYLEGTVFHRSDLDSLALEVSLIYLGVSRFSNL